MKTDSQKLIKKHDKLIQTDNLKVSSHVQREDNEWFINTLMFEHISAPFKYKRKQRYSSLVGNMVNITYYISNESVAGLDIEVMNIVRIKIA